MSMPTLTLNISALPAVKQERFTGTVKSFNTGSGFGFIDCPEAKRRFRRDVFLHKAQAGGELPVGMQVEFAIDINDKGMPQARDVRVGGQQEEAARAPTEVAAKQQHQQQQQQKKKSRRGSKALYVVPRLPEPPALLDEEDDDELRTDDLLSSASQEISAALHIDLDFEPDDESCDENTSSLTDCTTAASTPTPTPPVCWPISPAAVPHATPYIPPTPMGAYTLVPFMNPLTGIAVQVAVPLAP